MRSEHEGKAKEKRSKREAKAKQGPKQKAKQKARQKARQKATLDRVGLGPCAGGEQIAGRCYDVAGGHDLAYSHDVVERRPRKNARQRWLAAMCRFPYKNPTSKIQPSKVGILPKFCQNPILSLGFGGKIYKNLTLGWTLVCFYQKNNLRIGFWQTSDQNPTLRFDFRRFSTKIQAQKVGFL